MSPLIDRLGNQPKLWLQKGNELFNPIAERFSHRHERLRQRGTDLLSQLQESHERLFDRGQKALSTFEVNVLERVTELLSWAYGATGERAEALARTRDYVDERLAELHAEAETAQTPVEAPPAKAEPASAPASPTPPFENYDALNVKKLTARFNDLDDEGLEQARDYEAATKKRKTVFDAIDRRLG